MCDHFGRRLLVALLAVPILGFAPSAPLHAQEAMGDRITILVPNLAPAPGVRDRFGAQVASEIRKLIDDLRTHRTVSDRVLRDALRRYDLSQPDLFDCVQARQLALQEDWGLVLCGSYESVGDGQVRVVASFIGSGTGEAFDVEPFTVPEREARAAAGRILQTFDRWQTQLRHTVFCSEYLEIEQWDMALSNCQQALALNPGSVAARYLLSHVYWKTDQQREALAVLDDLLEDDPVYQDALKLAGIVATQLGDRDRARDYLDRYMALNPGDVRVRLTIATEIANAGDPEGALRFAQQGVTHEPENLDLRTYIGHYAINAAIQAEARMAQRNGTDASPELIADLYRTAAESYEKVRAEQGDATDAQILERLVIARVRLGDADAAVALGRNAVRIAAENPGVWEAYSRALEEAGQIDEAIAAIRRAEELGRTGPGLTHRVAMMQLRRGRTAEAVEVLRAATNRGDLTAHEAWRTFFSFAYNDRLRAGQHAEAFRILEIGLPLAVVEVDRMAHHFWMGYAVYEQGIRAEAPQTAESARRAKPMFERALQLFELARGYERVERSADVPRLIEAARRYIEIQDALIRRGR
jgi:tetratricopeptide (TPR) repeat protein